MSRPVRSFPSGFRVADLGTFPGRRAGTCPVPHLESPDPATAPGGVGPATGTGEPA